MVKVRRKKFLHQLRRFSCCVCGSELSLYIPLVPDTFPIHFDKLALDFGTTNVFRIQQSYQGTQLTIGGTSG
jgi:hypothetical protein